jgi:acetylornithine deacetylase/succinyl-diaminopimelate desuccinylase-like protein
MVHPAQRCLRESRSDVGDDEIMTGREDGLNTYIQDARHQFEEMLAEMVQIPSVSMDPGHAADMPRMAALAVQFLRGMGADAQIVRTEGYPVVSGGWMTDKKHPTLTIYNHLDVQPAQEPEWRHSPFTFRNDDGVYHGRGATDDKGPALTALWAARYAMDKRLPLNIQFVWELEEEIGSPNFAGALTHGSVIPRPDSVLVSDTIWIAKGRPAMPYGLRGLVGARLSLRTGETDAHSGVTGGAARNPLTELCDLAHACVDARSGRVQIPGFYDDVVPPTKAEIKGFLDSGFQVKRFMKAYRFKALRTMDPAEVLQRIWASPTFEVHGLVGGYRGPGVKTIVPAHGELKVSMRLVPNQQPEKIFELLRRFVAKQNPLVEVEPEGMLQPFRGVFSGPYADAARRAMRAGFGKDPAFVREGGSIGAVSVMQRAWRVPILFIGLSLPEHGYHAPNEHFDWGQASGGMRAFATYFEELAKMGVKGKGVKG